MNPNDESMDDVTSMAEPMSTSRMDAISVGGSFTPGSAALRGLDADDLAAIHALPPTSALLIARRGPNMGARFLLNAPSVSAGRHVKSDIFLDDVTVSRRHAVFERVDHGYVVKDRGSLNGTYVNGELVEECPLHTNDEVRIGKYQFTYFASQQAA